MGMRLFLAVALAVLALACAPFTAFAQNIRLKDDEALIVMTVNAKAYETQRLAALKSGLYTKPGLAYNYLHADGIETFSLRLGMFDPQTHLPVYQDWNASPQALLYGDGDVANRVLIAKVKAGDYAIFGQILELHRGGWLYCFDADTVTFHVAPGAYAYIGSVSPFEASLTLAVEVDKGAIPKLRPYADVDDMVNGELSGFDAGDESDVARARAYLNRLKPGAGDAMIRTEVKPTFMKVDKTKGCPA
jgi:hypothetical protein